MIDIGSLSWHFPIGEQHANMAKIQILSDDEIEMLILPSRRQDCWENCAVLLSALDDARLVPFSLNYLNGIKT